MKKLLSLLLVLTMLLASLSLFTSCFGGDDATDNGTGDGSTNGTGDGNTDDTGSTGSTGGTGGTGGGTADGGKEELKKDTIASFFDLGVDFSAPMEEALLGGSVEFTVSENRVLFGEDFGGASSIAYFDAENGRVVTDLAFTLQGEDYSIRTFTDAEQNFILQSAELFGSETAYMLKLATLVDDLEDSALSDMLGITPEQIEELKAALSEAINTAPAPEKTPAEIKAFYDELLACFPVTDGSASVVVGDQTIACTTQSFTITDAGIKTAILATVDFAGVDAATREEIVAALNDIFFAESSTLTLYHDAADALFVKAELTATSEGESLAMALTYADNTLSFVVNDTISATGIALHITKEVEDTETTFRLSATESLAGADEEVFAMTFRYEKTDGEFTLSVTANAQTVSFGGIIAVKADEATFAITSLGADEVSIGMNIAFTIRATATIPEPPTDTKDVLSLSESELAALAETVMSSPLAVLFGELISNMQTPPVE